MTRPPSASRSRKLVVGMKIRVALVSALLALSGCGTLGKGGGPDISVTNPPASPPSGAKVATTIISAMSGGLVGG